MLDKLRQLKDLKKIQDEISKEKVEVEKKGVKLVLNGKLEVEEVFLNPEISKEEQEKILKECINEAIQRIQFRLASKMQEIGKVGF